MALIDLEDKIVEIVNYNKNDEFIYEFLKVYEIPNSTITKLKNGINNLSKDPDEVHLKSKLYFKKTDKSVFKSFSDLEEKIKPLGVVPRYLLVTDFQILLAKDTKTQETLDISFKELPMHFDFFLAWNGIEKVDFQKENPLDIKAAERFARLFDVLNKEINHESEDDKHALNLFLMRLLFCLFAEDTGIFDKGIFTNGIKQYTHEEGSNMNNYISGLFKVLDLPSRDDVDTIYKGFPYVNGQLFREPHKPINFNYNARKLMVECGELLEWSKINPDIFGSMIQAVATEDNRSHLGMHYTSVPNIMKVINPLFLDEIKQQFEEIKSSWDSSEENHKQTGTRYRTIRVNHEKRLEELMNKIRKMKFFDPACGSGNFLIITYKELRKLEIEIYKLLNEIRGSEMLVYDPLVTLSQFYGIEIDEFASDIAKLSLWIAEHQMNLELKEAIVNAVRPTLPLKSAGDIKNGNALELDWIDVCPREIEEDVFIFGNPPYLGAKKQNENQKKDLRNALDNNEKYKKMDYICGWFYLGMKYIRKTSSKLAFVSTNSITQGEQVPMLWPSILESCCISFAHTSFKWNNNAKNNAAVIVVIIGLETKEIDTNKMIITGNKMKVAKNINPYLVDAENVIVNSLNSSISNLPSIVLGNLPLDGGHLIFSKEEYYSAIEEYECLIPFFKKYVGSREFINQDHRYVLWLDKESYLSIRDNYIISERISLVEKFRKNGGISAKSIANIPFEFFTKKERENAIKKHHQFSDSEMLTIIIPRVSSENRKYIPMGLVGEDTVISDSAMAIYDAPLWLLGLLESEMHMTWLRSVGGRLKTDYRYSGGMVYNTFPVPDLSLKKKNAIENVILNILDIRAELGSSLATLYDQKKMPQDLKEAHDALDELIDSTYTSKKINNSEERLSLLLSMYTHEIKSRRK